ncbi:hypothetical protein DIE15_20625 [Burkholderia sp. Bp9031]|uniref:hypothetical protein n=1 Tax=Burkholderia sp. Bp9031 TaxID=2184566 RepID=UPI000F5EDF63|nr:hypothetical protein [Burkholderia sp. Bp9031]RQZ13793.1 hypothetical protein DIE15_20625 [Burkholderia sp. Bp9031]
MTPIPAARPSIVVLAMLALSGCYYTGPYGYAPYYAPVPATVSQREIPVAPANAGPVASTPAAPTVPPPADDYAYAPAPVYAAPAYVPYPAYYPAYYPGWYGPPVTIGLGFWGHWGGGYRGGYWRRPWGGGHWGGGHWGGGGHRH